MIKMFYTFRMTLTLYNLPNAKHHHNMGKCILFTFIILLKSITAFCQIQGPQPPQFPSTQQVFNGGSNQQTQMGGTAQDVINQQNRNSQQRSGYVTPSSNNPQTSVDRQQQRKDYEDVKADLHKMQNTPVAINYVLPSHAGEKGTEFYQKAYQEINDMLTGKTPLSLKKAVFLVENAYLDSTLSYEAYDKRIQSYAFFCRLKMLEEKSDTGNEAKNNMLFRLMADTLTVTDPTTKQKHLHYPIHYDFDDFWGKEDWTKMFVCKLMATNFGQCHSMPLLYRIVANEIGAQSFLSTSPNHLFVKYKSGNQWRNVELTNGHMTTDAYNMASGYIKSEGIKSHVYLDTLSPRKEIALMLQDLAIGYSIKYGMDAFVLKCANTGLKYYPNDASGIAIKANYNTVLFQYVVSQKQGQTPQQVLSDPRAFQLYKNMHAMYDTLDNTGYAQIPPDAYEDWLKSIDVEKRKQDYELFLQYQKQHKLSIRHENN